MSFYETVRFEAEVVDGVAIVRAADVSRLRNREGWAHGGAIAALADAALTQAADASGVLGPGAATAELLVNFLEPATGETLEAEGAVVAVHERRVEVRAEIRSGGRVIAVARAMVTKGGVAR